MVRGRKRAAHLLVGLGLVAAMTTACGASSSSSDKVITIADIQPLTGASGQYGRQAVEGAKVAVAVINAKGGVLGKNLRLEVADDASTASQSTSLMKKYGSDTGIPAIIGPTYSSNFIADSPFAEKYKVATISSGSTAPWQGDFNDWTFRASVPGMEYLPQLVSQVKQEANIQTAAQIWAIDNEALAQQGEALTSVFADNGVKVLTNQKATNDTTDFHAQVTSIMSNPPDLVTIGLITNGAALFTEQLREAGYKGLLMASGNTLLDPALFKDSNGAADGLIVPSSFVDSSTEPKVKEFVQEFKKEYHTVPNAQQAFGYDAVLLLADAIERAGSTDREEVRDALGSTKDFQGVQGSFTYRNSGDNTTPSVHVLQLTDTGFVQYPGNT
jgi:branched-chain amino acid transport system substrate-binding protein